MSFVDAVLGLATGVTTAIVAQADLPSDDRAFWRTRPIPAIGLALAKLLAFALLFVAVPSAINAGRLLAYGAPVSAIGAASVQIAVLAGATVVPAWILALVTRTLPRFLGTAAGLLVGGNMLWAAILYWTDLWYGARSISPRRLTALLDWQYLDTHGWWWALAVTVAGLAMLVGHYWHRRLAVSVSVALALLLAPGLLPRHEALTPAEPGLAHLVSGRVGIVGRVQLPPPEAVASRQRSRTSFPVPLGVSFSLPPLPVGVSATVLARRARVTAGEVVQAADAWQCCFSPGPMAVVAPGLAPKPGDHYGANAQGFSIPLSAVETLRGASVSIDADVEVRFERHRLAGVIPLRPGSSLRVGHRVIEILEVEPRHSLLLVRYTQFPSFDAAGESQLSVFVSDAARTRVSATKPEWRWDTAPMAALTSKRDWVSGRSWVWRFHVVVSDTKVFGPDLQLHVVEARAAGSTRMPFHAAGVPVQNPPR